METAYLSKKHKIFHPQKANSQNTNKTNYISKKNSTFATIKTAIKWHT